MISGNCAHLNPLFEWCPWVGCLYLLRSQCESPKNRTCLYPLILHRTFPNPKTLKPTPVFLFTIIILNAHAYICSVSTGMLVPASTVIFQSNKAMPYRLRPNKITFVSGPWAALWGRKVVHRQYEVQGYATITNKESSYMAMKHYLPCTTWSNLRRRRLVLIPPN